MASRKKKGKKDQTKTRYRPYFNISEDEILRAGRGIWYEYRKQLKGWHENDVGKQCGRRKLRIFEMQEWIPQIKLPQKSKWIRSVMSYSRVKEKKSNERSKPSIKICLLYIFYWSPTRTDNKWNIVPARQTDCEFITWLLNRRRVIIPRIQKW